MASVPMNDEQDVQNQGNQAAIGIDTQIVNTGEAHPLGTIDKRTSLMINNSGKKDVSPMKIDPKHAWLLDKTAEQSPQKTPSLSDFWDKAQAGKSFNQISQDWLAEQTMDSALELAYKTGAYPEHDFFTKRLVHGVETGLTPLDDPGRQQVFAAYQQAKTMPAGERATFMANWLSQNYGVGEAGAADADRYISLLQTEGAIDRFGSKAVGGLLNGTATPEEVRESVLQLKQNELEQLKRNFNALIAEMPKVPGMTTPDRMSQEQALMVALASIIMPNQAGRIMMSANQFLTDLSDRRNKTLMDQYNLDMNQFKMKAGFLSDQITTASNELQKEEERQLRRDITQAVTDRDFMKQTFLDNRQIRSLNAKEREGVRKNTHDLIKMYFDEKTEAATRMEINQYLRSLGLEISANDTEDSFRRKYDDYLQSQIDQKLSQIRNTDAKTATEDALRGFKEELAAANVNYKNEQIENLKFTRALNAKKFDLSLFMSMQRVEDMVFNRNMDVYKANRDAFEYDFTNMLKLKDMQTEAIDNADENLKDLREQLAGTSANGYVNLKGLRDQLAGMSADDPKYKEIQAAISTEEAVRKGDSEYASIASAMDNEEAIRQGLIAERAKVSATIEHARVNGPQQVTPYAPGQVGQPPASFSSDGYFSGNSTGGMPDPNLQKSMVDGLRTEAAAGTKYVWGGQVLGQKVDCSGLVCALMDKIGVSLPEDMTANTLYGYALPTSEPVPSDLVFFKKPGSAVSHVGVIQSVSPNGELMVTHASSGKGKVVTVPLKQITSGSLTVAGYGRLPEMVPGGEQMRGYLDGNAGSYSGGALPPVPSGVQPWANAPRHPSQVPSGAPNGQSASDSKVPGWDNIGPKVPGTQTQKQNQPAYTPPKSGLATDDYRIGVQFKLPVMAKDQIPAIEAQLGQGAFFKDPMDTREGDLLYVRDMDGSVRVLTVKSIKGNKITLFADGKEFVKDATKFKKIAHYRPRYR